MEKHSVSVSMSGEGRGEGDSQEFSLSLTSVELSQLTKLMKDNQVKN